MVDCRKQQREIHAGEERIRCIHRDSPLRLEIVEPAQCESCLFAMARKRVILPCDELEQLPVIKPGSGEYPNCPFRYTSKDKALRCSITNLEVTPKICGRCDKGTREHEARGGEKVKKYFGAIRRWYALGKPTRSKEEVKKLFEENCKGCDRYDPVKHACKNCGCAVSTKSSPLANKLAMASEHCPLGRF